MGFELYEYVDYVGEDIIDTSYFLYTKGKINIFQFDFFQSSILVLIVNSFIM